MQHKKRSFLSFLCLVALVCSGNTSVHAHGTGLSFEKTIADNIIDIGASREELVAGVPVSFDFNLLKEGTKAEVPFTSVWVRIYQGENEFYAGNIEKAHAGPTTMLYQFARPGTYTLFARFEDAEGAIAEAAFDAIVSGDATPAPPESAHSPMKYAGAALVGALFGASLVYASDYRKKRIVVE